MPSAKGRVRQFKYPKSGISVAPVLLRDRPRDAYERGGRFPLPPTFPPLFLLCIRFLKLPKGRSSDIACRNNFSSRGPMYTWQKKKKKKVRAASSGGGRKEGGSRKRPPGEIFFCSADVDYPASSLPPSEWQRRIYMLPLSNYCMPHPFEDTEASFISSWQSPSASPPPPLSCVARAGVASVF